jgi:hypothetical protein
MYDHQNDIVVECFQPSRVVTAHLRKPRFVLKTFTFPPNPTKIFFVAKVGMGDNTTKCRASYLAISAISFRPGSEQSS